jgi:hypothetical protein
MLKFLYLSPSFLLPRVYSSLKPVFFASENLPALGRQHPLVQAHSATSFAGISRLENVENHRGVTDPGVSRAGRRAGFRISTSPITIRLTEQELSLDWSGKESKDFVKSGFWGLSE